MCHSDLIWTGKRCLSLATVALIANALVCSSFNSPPALRSCNISRRYTVLRSSTVPRMDVANPRAEITPKPPQQKKLSNAPVVVSKKAEELSHSSSTLKLEPSFDLFQLLPEEEGGGTPVECVGNMNRDATFYMNGEADTLAGYQIMNPQNDIKKLPDPFKMVENELQPFSDSIKELVSSDQPILSMAAKHFFEKRHGKRFRPTIVQLLGKACAEGTPEEAIGSSWAWSGASDVEVPGGAVTPSNHFGSDPWRRQAQLGQIVEMIHVASLIHDDVLDEADTRRGGEAVHKLYSNKVAVLAGDYLLARSALLLARLENTAVVQIMATALESLVAGEIMQLKSAPDTLLRMETYLQKSYYKTASLICYACRSVALLGGHAYGSNMATASEEFGFHLGLAYQIQDDILDFTAAASVLGKPALADMDLGLSTAPILYAAQEFKELRPLVKRRFKNKGDKQKALEFLYKSDTAMDKAKNLAKFHAQVCTEYYALYMIIVRKLTFYITKCRKQLMRCYACHNQTQGTLLCDLYTLS